MARQRRGMLIKNTDERSVEIKMATRTMHLGPGEEKLITAEEVRDSAMRESLQLRSISIVRPATEAEEETLHQDAPSEGE